MKSKVYCKNCKYLQENAFGYGLIDYCSRIIKLKDTPYSIEKIIIDDYKLQNKNNTCEYYERKWWKFWIKEENEFKPRSFDINITIDKRKCKNILLFLSGFAITEGTYYHLKGNEIIIPDVWEGDEIILQCSNNKETTHWEAIVGKQYGDYEIGIITDIEIIER